MRVPLSWLKEYVDVDLPVEELAHRLTMAGLEVGEIERIGAGWTGCSVGRVLAVEPHPNADRLRLCTVDLGGDEQLQVVCGAPNVAEGQRIAFARVGATLVDSQTGARDTLKVARIRGVVSEGMVCSERELGLGDDHAGILVLPDDAPVGAPLADYLGDTVLDLDVTANRPDGLSVLGVAYETAAIGGVSVREPATDYPEDDDPIEGRAAVEVVDADLCPRYTATLVTGVTVGPSPRWMQERLARAGMRPINNVVDVTNYVLLEYGQPLHAFDFDRLAGRRIVVRQAVPGERFVTLDGIERQLDPPMLVIADAERAIALAGVMGGANTEVTEATTAVLLESASFHPLSTRRTADALRLRTEASLRFEKGARPGLPPPALWRATRLLIDVAGGTAAKGTLDAYPERGPAPSVALTQSGMQRLLGTDVTLDEARRTLEALGFGCEPVPGDALRVVVPYWRADIALEEDLLEEVARVIGYDRFPTEPLSTPIPAQHPDPARELKEQVRDLLAAAGLQEVISYSLVSDRAIQDSRVELPEAASPLRVVNPISPEREFLRTSLRPGLLEAFSANHRRQESSALWLFEVGRAYFPRNGDLPDERETAAGILAGPPAVASWQGGNDASGFYDAKGVIEMVLDRLGIEASFEPADDPFHHPGRAASVVVEGRRIGGLGEVHSGALERFEIESEGVALFELDLESVLAAMPERRGRLDTPSVYPGAVRDLALVLDLGVPAGRVKEIVERQSLVASATVFDVYVGPQAGAGKRSLAYRVLFQHPDRTLTAEEVGRAMERILRDLADEVGAVQRG